MTGWLVFLVLFAIIFRRRGYGRSWSHWIQGFECVPYVPLTIPDVPLMHLTLQLTQYDTDLAVLSDRKNVIDGVPINIRLLWIEPRKMER